MSCSSIAETFPNIFQHSTWCAGSQKRMQDCMMSACSACCIQSCAFLVSGSAIQSTVCTRNSVKNLAFLCNAKFHVCSYGLRLLLSISQQGWLSEHAQAADEPSVVQLPAPSRPSKSIQGHLRSAPLPRSLWQGKNWSLSTSADRMADMFTKPVPGNKLQI